MKKLVLLFVVLFYSLFWFSFVHAKDVEGISLCKTFTGSREKLLNHIKLKLTIEISANNAAPEEREKTEIAFRKLVKKFNMITFFDCHDSTEDRTARLVLLPGKNYVKLIIDQGGQKNILKLQWNYSTDKDGIEQLINKIIRAIGEVYEFNTLENYF